jgi:hypothetical protein
MDSGSVLTHSSEALYAKEHCGLLAILEAVSLGYGKNIACVLAKNALENIIRKVEKSLRKVIIRDKKRKHKVSRKALAA